MPINLANINTYFSGSYTSFISNVSTIFLRNFANSCSTFRVNSITINHANATGSGITDQNYGGYCNNNNPIPLSPNANVNITLYDSSTQLFSNIFSLNNIPSNRANNLVLAATRNNPIILDEGDYLISTANVSDMLAMYVTYDELSELTQSTYLSRIPIEYLVIAGGAAGGVGPGGGGGAGGLLCGTTFFNSNVCHSIVVGAGGSAITASSITGCGSNSFICNSSAGNIFLAIGGGGGGGTNTIPGHDAYAGGSGGGTGIYATCAVAAGISGQGFPGGLMNTPGGPWPGTGSGGGGGGGANQTGESPPTSTSPGGYGGNGCLIYITGVATYYAGGGGGGGVATSSPARPAGTGGLGGGGPGGASNSNGTNGSTNSGGGGGGGNNNSPSGTSNCGGTGGSGIVILRYPTDYQLANVTGTVTCAQNGCYRIYQFTGSGSITI